MANSKPPIVSCFLLNCTYLCLKMPKTPAPKTSLMRSFANEFENESLNYDKEKSSLVCRCCGSVLGSIQSANMKKSVVVQHIGSQKHRKNLTAFKNQKKLDFTADTFNRDLCRVSSISSIIFMVKLSADSLTVELIVCFIASRRS